MRNYLLGGMQVNCVGIDVSKGKSMIAVMRPFGEVVLTPFEVQHTAIELSELTKTLKRLVGETRVVMEATGNYHVPIALALQSAGFYVSIVNAILVHDYGNNSLRRAKTDKKDAIKLANYGLDHWLTLPRYVPEEDTWMMLKVCYRQYQQYSKVQTILKNNLISLLDTTFPSINRMFNSPIRSDGREKWLDFVETFWHCECVSKLSENAFSAKYQKWCQRNGYNFSQIKAQQLHSFARSCMARAESQGVDCNIGIAERAVRMVILMIGAIIGFFAGDIYFTYIIYILVILSYFTVGQRIVHVWRKLK